MGSLTNPAATEYFGNDYYYPVPSVDLFDLKRDAKTAVILGAGPAGLIAALTLKDEGYDNVVILEKRDRFSRMNIINLHPESQCVLRRLNILGRFIERASLIKSHRNHVFCDGMKIYQFDDLAYEIAINPHQPFDADDVLDGFQNETLYSISLADLQDLLSKIACERGVEIQANTAAYLIFGSNGAYSVKAEVGESTRTIMIEAPDLIVIAEGGKSATFSTLGGNYLAKDGLWLNENWIFGHYQCNPDYGVSHLLFEFYAKGEDLIISNCIFLPLKNEVNIAVTVKDTDIPNWRIKEIISEQAIKILDASGIRSSENKIVWHSNKVVRITPKSADRCHFGKNVILIGDAVGTNSPVAALGGTLCTSAYSYALRELVRELEFLDPEVALTRYSHRAQSYVNRWHNRVGEIKQKIKLDIMQKAIFQRNGTR